MTPRPDWRSVPTWCMGANDRFGTCFFAMFGNWLALHTGEVMPDAEIENAAREMEGFSAYDPTSDRGEVMRVGIDYILQNGWPGDPTMKPDRVDQTSPDAIVATVQRYGCAFAALALPADQDFTDAALGEDGVAGHAVFVVAADPFSVTFITWQEPKTVTMAWWRRFAREVYGIVTPAALAPPVSVPT